MKYIIGVCLTLLLLSFSTYIVLGFWDISLFDVSYLDRIYKTFGVLLIVAIIIVIIIAYFFKNPHKGYDESKGKIAHPKK